MPSALLVFLMGFAFHDPIPPLQILRQDVELQISLMQNHGGGGFAKGVALFLVDKGHGVLSKQIQIAPTDIDAFLEERELAEEARPFLQYQNGLSEDHQGGAMEQSTIAS